MAKRRKLTPTERLARVRGTRHFNRWDTFVDAKRIARSVTSIDTLIDDLTALGDTPDEAKARRAVTRCVKRFNKMDDDGWINTIERDDICDVIDALLTRCGSEPHEDWYDERDW